MRFRKIVVAVATGALAMSALAACGGTDDGGPPAAGGETTGSNGAEGGGATSDVGDVEGIALLAMPEFRQAIKLAIDMQAVIDGLMDGKADVANALMAPGPFKPESGLEAWDYDPDRAKALLDDIGWDSNLELDLVYYYGDQATVDFMSAVQQYLAQVGIKVAPRMLEGDLGSQLWTAPADRVNGPSAVEWDIAYAAVAALAPHEYYERFLDTYPGNSYWPLNQEYKDLILKAGQTADLDEQVAAFHDIVAWDNANLPAVPLYYQPVFVAVSDDLDRAGADFGNEQYNYDWQIHKWTLPEDSDGTMTLNTNGGAVEFFETPFLNPGLHLSTKVLWEHLIVASGDLSSFTPGLAESFDVSADGTEVVLTMRDGITWHDGEPITADDVKFTLELTAKVPAVHSVLASTVARLEGAQAFKDGSADEIAGVTVDGNVVTLTFEELDPNVLLTLSQLPPLPKHLLEDADPLQIQQDPYFQAPVGSGPFKIVDVRMGDYTVFEAFDGYWAGAPEIDRVEMYASGESDPNLVVNIEAGSVDYAYTKSVEDATAIEAVAGISVESVDVMYTRLFFVNSFPRE